MKYRDIYIMFGGANQVRVFRQHGGELGTAFTYSNAITSLPALPYTKGEIEVQSFLYLFNALPCQASRNC